MIVKARLDTILDSLKNAMRKVMLIFSPQPSIYDGPSVHSIFKEVGIAQLTLFNIYARMNEVINKLSN